MHACEQYEIYLLVVIFPYITVTCIDHVDTGRDAYTYSQLLYIANWVYIK